MVANPVLWTTQDLDAMPDDGGQRRYEIVSGELFVTRAPHVWHQGAGGNINAELINWSRKTGLGRSFEAPGVVFTELDAVIPDVVWASKERLANGLDEAGHFTVAPELMVEVLSAGERNEERDRRVKLKLYSLHGVQEYWIVNWRIKEIEVYRRENGQLQKVVTLLAVDSLTSPLLPGFKCTVESVFQ